MQTIYNKLTNKVVSVETDFQETEEFGVTDLLCTENFLITKFNPISNQFYEGITPEEIERYKQEQIQILNENQYSELQPYDWYFTRLVRKGIEVPKEIIDITNEIDEKYKKLKEKYK